MTNREIIRAILKINPNAEVNVGDNSLDEITWLNGTTPIPVADIEAKRRAEAFSTGIGGLLSAGSGAANALINPKLASENPIIPEIQSGLSVNQGITSGENIFGTPVAGLNYNQSQFNNIMQNQQDLNNLIDAGVTQDQLENITIDTELQNNNPVMDELNYGNQVIIKQ